MEEMGEMLPKEGSNRKYYLLVALFSSANAAFFVFFQYWPMYAHEKGLSIQDISTFSGYISFLHYPVLLLLSISLLFFVKNDHHIVNRFVIAKIFLISVAADTMTRLIFGLFYGHYLNFALVASSLFLYFSARLSLYVLILFFPKERVTRKKAGIFAIISAIWFPVFPGAIPLGVIPSLIWIFLKEKHAATLTAWSFLGAGVGGFIVSTLSFFIKTM